MKREWLRLPKHTHFEIGAHVGRFSSAVIVGVLPDHPLLVLSEIPNYHYVGDGEIELSGVTTVEWAELVVREWAAFAGDSSCRAWVDPDTEFSREVMRSKLRLRKNVGRGPELRTEIVREYFLEQKIYFAPWLTVLPGEITKARWPPEESSAYQIRATGSDYSLAAMEQVVSRRPAAHALDRPAQSTFISKMRSLRSLPTVGGDPHLGTT